MVALPGVNLSANWSMFPSTWGVILLFVKRFNSDSDTLRLSVSDTENNLSFPAIHLNSRGGSKLFK